MKEAIEAFFKGAKEMIGSVGEVGINLVSFYADFLIGSFKAAEKTKFYKKQKERVEKYSRHLQTIAKITVISILLSVSLGIYTIIASVYGLPLAVTAAFWALILCALFSIGFAIIGAEPGRAQ